MHKKKRKEKERKEKKTLFSCCGFEYFVYRLPQSSLSHMTKDDKVDIHV